MYYKGARVYVKEIIRTRCVCVCVCVCVFVYAYGAPQDPKMPTDKNCLLFREIMGISQFLQTPSTIYIQFSIKRTGYVKELGTIYHFWESFETNETKNTQIKF